MRYAIISDIHSNLQAIQAALKTINRRHIDEIICLGDIIGYNANPGECIDLIRNTPKIKHIILGNHDASLVKKESSYFHFSRDAYDGIRHSEIVLNKEQCDWLRDFPFEKTIENEDISFLIMHGSPKYPNEYILSRYNAQNAIATLDECYKLSLGFFGHTHAASVIESTKKNLEFRYLKEVVGKIVHLKFDDPINKTLINPGSIGQPRGNCPPSFAIFDTKKMTVKIHSFDYDVAAAQKAIMDAGYSNHIAERLGKNE